MYSIKLDIGSVSTPVNGNGYISVSPILENAILKKFRDDDNRFVIRYAIEGLMLFYGDEYTALETIKNNEDYFVGIKVYYNLEEKCSGKINLSSGNWDENKKIVDVKVDIIDQYSDIFKNIKEEWNIKQSTKTGVRINYESQIYDITLPCFDGSYTEAQQYYDPDGRRARTPGVASDDWTYFTYMSSISCGGTVRQYTFRTTYINFPESTYVESVIFDNWWLKKRTTSEFVSSITLSEFFLVSDILYSILNKISNDTILSSNYCSYLSDANKLKYLALADKSDVKRYDAANKATYENITFDTLMSMFKYFFNLEWYITSDNYFMMSRPPVAWSGFNPRTGVNLYPYNDFTNLPNAGNIVSNQLNYNIKNNYRLAKETLTLEVSNDKRWYSESFDYRSPDENSGDYNLETFNNNISYLIDDPDEANDNGFVLVATELASGYYNIVNKKIDSNDDAPLVNGMLSAKRLMLDRHLIDKPYSKAWIFDETVLGNYYSIDLEKRPDKEVIYKNVPIYDIDLIRFDIYVNIGIGNVVAESFEVDMSCKKFSTFKGSF